MTTTEMSQKKSMGFSHEMDSEGRHFVNTPLGPGPKFFYQEPAVVEYKGRRFIAFTAYWSGLVPIERVFELCEV